MEFLNRTFGHQHLVWKALEAILECFLLAETEVIEVMEFLKELCSGEFSLLKML